MIMLPTAVSKIKISRTNKTSSKINSNSSLTPTAEPEPDTPVLNRLDQEFIDKMNRIIEEYITSEDLDMAFMTDKMAMSHSTFYRKVKALTGMTAQEYIRRLRLQRAAKLLADGEHQVSEAAMMTGFNDLGNFRSAFKKEFGVTPSKYMEGRN